MIDNNIDYGIKSISVTAFSLNIKSELIDKFIKEPIFNQYTFQINTKMKGLIEPNIVILEVNLIVYLDKEKKIELANITVHNIFGVKDLVKFHNTKNNKLKLPQYLERNLILISVSHTRAILITKCAGTFLNNALFPLINPDTLFSK